MGQTCSGPEIGLHARGDSLPPPGAPSSIQSVAPLAEASRGSHALKPPHAAAAAAGIRVATRARGGGRACLPSTRSSTRSSTGPELSPSLGPERHSCLRHVWALGTGESCDPHRHRRQNHPAAPPPFSLLQGRPERPVSPTRGQSRTG